MSLLSRRTPPRPAKPAKPAAPMLFRIPDPAGGPGIIIPPSWLDPAGGDDSEGSEAA